MIDKQKVLKGLECCILRNPDDHARCSECPYEWNCVNRLKMDALELLKQPEDKELHLADLDALVNMIAIKKRRAVFSPYEVGLALVAHGQHDEQFEWGETIKYSPSEVVQILNEVMQDDGN